MNQKTRKQRRNTIRRRRNNKRRQRKTRVKRGGNNNEPNVPLLNMNMLGEKYISSQRLPMTPYEIQMMRNAMKFEAEEQKRIKKLQLLKQQIEEQLAQPPAYFEPFSSEKNVEPLNNPYLHSNTIIPEKQETKSNKPHIQFDPYHSSSQTKPSKIRKPLQRLSKDQFNQLRQGHKISDMRVL